MSGPLHGIRVLDLSRILSGPFCTMLLSDLGAEVIKVERPGEGDPARMLAPFVGEDSAYFISVNRGKKSITLNLAIQEGQKVLRDLVPHFDVLVENFVPGTTARFGLDYEHLKQLNPRLVYASISGFGQDGPSAKRPALDIIVQAMGGMMSVTGQPGGPPLRPGASLGDSVAGVFCALAVVSALWQRQSSGGGQYIDMSMLDCQVTMLENAFARYFASGKVPMATGTRHPSAAPFQAYHGSDDDFVVALITNDIGTWQRLCLAIGLPDLAADQRFQTNAGRSQYVDILENILQSIFSLHPAQYWLERLSASGIPCGPVNNIGAVARDPQVIYRKMLTAIPHSTKGRWQVANTPFKLSDSATGPSGPSPLLGEHTRQVLQHILNLSDQELDSLKSKGAI
jgi:CoA:oxalate CoA-transferase